MRIACLIFYFVLVSIARADELNSRFSDIDVKLAEALVSAVIADGTFSMPAGQVEDVQDPAMKSIWGRAEPDIESRIKSAKIGFGRPLLTEGGDISLEKFEIELRFGEDSVLCLSSHPAFAEYQKGLRMERAQADAQVRLFPGANGTSFVMALARGDDTDSRGMLLCPVEKKSIQPAGGIVNAEQKALPEVWEFSGFRADGLDVEVDGHAAARFSTGSRRGVIRASIFTSSWVRPGFQLVDEVTARDPSAGVDYLPDKSKSFDNRLKKSEAVAGIRSLLEMKNPAGYVRNVKSEELLWLKTLSVPGKLKSATSFGVAQVGIESCVALITRRSVHQKYAKEEPVAE